MVENVATVKLHGHDMGAVVWLNNQGHALFEYDPALSRERISAIGLERLILLLLSFGMQKKVTRPPVRKSTLN